MLSCSLSDLYTIASLRYQTPFYICLLLLLFVVDGRCASPVTVTVTGVEGRLLENVLARLRINIFRENEHLSVSEIRRLHNQAEGDIIAALQPYGYYHATVTGTLGKNKTGWQADYAIRTGAPVVVSEVSVTIIGDGRVLPELADATERFPLQAGDVLEHQRYERGKKELLRTARALGMLDARFVKNRIEVDRNLGGARIELVFDTGTRYLFGPVQSEQRVISDELLSRFVPFLEGEPFQRALVQELQRDLYRTNYFSLVVVNADTAHPEGYQVPVSVDLQPLDHYNRYSFGVGYATDIGANVRFEWLNRMVNTEGHHMFSSLLVGEQKSLCQLNYTVPVADPRFNSVTASGLWNRENWNDTVSSKLSTGLSYEYATAKYLFGISIEALEEDYQIGDDKDTVSLLMPGARGSWAWADDVIATENGLRLSAEVAGASTDILSGASFIKMRGDGKVILSPLSGWRLIGRGTVGGILVGEISDIPPSVRFYAGGEKSVRGYSYRSLGPQDDDGNVVGGRWLLTGSVEIEKRLSEYWRAAVFYDVGNAMDDLAVELASGIGIGIGVALPFGQARLDLAFPLNDEGQSQVVFLSVGSDL